LVLYRVKLNLHRYKNLRFEKGNDLHRYKITGKNDSVEKKGEESTQISRPFST